MKVLALLAVLLMQAGGQTRLQTGMVRGEIRGLNGLPAAGIRVSAMPNRITDPAASADTMVALGQTDSLGRYTLEGIPPGRYVIAAGLIDSPTYYPGVNFLDSARTISVTAATTLSGIDFALVQSPGVRVSGRVKGYPAGLPRGLLRIMVTGPNAPRGRIPEAQVEPDGTFEFPAVAPGVYDIRIAPPSLVRAPTRIDVRDNAIDSITLDAGILVAGKAVVNDGSPLPQRSVLAQSGVPNLPAAVQILAQSTNPRQTGSVVTPIRASDGLFLAMLPEGEYRLAATTMPLGYDVQSMMYGPTDLLQSSLRVSNEPAPGAEEIRVTLTTAPPATGAWKRVSGRVFGRTAGLSAQYRVIAESEPVLTPILAGSTPRRMGEASVRDDGTFEIPDVPPGAYSLRLINPVAGGTPPTRTGIAVSDADISGVELLASTQPAGVKVSGNVILAAINERTLMPHTAVLFGAASRTFHTPISSDGSFAFPNVPPGEYDLRTLPLTLPNESRRVPVQTQELRDLRVALPPQSNLQGRIRMEDGRSLPDLGGAALKLTSPLMEMEIPLGADGSFVARIAHGEYGLSAVNVPRGYAITSSSLNVNAAGTAEIAIGLRGVTP